MLCCSSSSWQSSWNPVLGCIAKVAVLRLYQLSLLIALISSDTSLPFNDGTEGNSLIWNLVAERLSEYRLVGKCYKYRSSCTYLEGHLNRPIYMKVLGASWRRIHSIKKDSQSQLRPSRLEEVVDFKYCLTSPTAHFSARRTPFGLTIISGFWCWTLANQWNRRWANSNEGVSFLLDLHLWDRQNPSLLLGSIAFSEITSGFLEGPIWT